MKYIIFLFRAIWLALSLLILFFSMHRLSLLDSTRDVSELISLMSYGMMVICFPTGIVFFIALIFIGTVSDIIGVRIDSKYIMAIIIWLYFLSGGYIQWFVLSGNDSNLLIVFYVQIMPDDFVMQLHRF